MGKKILAVPKRKLILSQVTLCAATSVNVKATIQALEKSISEVSFAHCKLFTDSDVVKNHPLIEIIRIPRLASSKDYSEFMLTQIANYVETSHCLVVQWDGHVLDAQRWRSDFLSYDYIGASWPQFDDGCNVGNGGFSLRSRRLMEACREQGFRPAHPEDVAIGRLNRIWLENQGMRFPSRQLADQFATERVGDLQTSFGYHGVWNMPLAIGNDAFWKIYRELDDRSTIKHDFTTILNEVGRGPNGFFRACWMLADYLRHVLKGILLSKYSAK